MLWSSGWETPATVGLSMTAWIAIIQSGRWRWLRSTEIRLIDCRQTKFGKISIESIILLRMWEVHGWRSHIPSDWLRPDSFQSLEWRDQSANKGTNEKCAVALVEANKWRYFFLRRQINVEQIYREQCILNALSNLRREETTWKVPIFLIITFNRTKCVYTNTVNVDLCEQSQNTNNNTEQYEASTNNPNSLNVNPNPWSKISEIAP